MRLIKMLAVFAFMACAGFSQLPGFYKQISRVTWVVKSIDAPLKGWTALGMTNVRDFGEVPMQSQYRGKAAAGQAHVATGRIGNLAIDMLQPGTGEDAFNSFLTAHGDGIFALVHEVPSQEEMTKEIARMRAAGVEVLQTLAGESGEGPVFTFFDTEPQGKYVLGLVYWPGRATVTGDPKISHIAFVIRDPAPVSAYWAKLGFPVMPVSHASPREDSRYHGKPLLLPFDVGWHRYAHPTFEWIIPPQDPANCYADTLKMHGEGVHHLGLPVDNLEDATAAYQKLGYGILQSGAWGENGKKNSGRYAYMDTDSIGGVTAELIRAIPE